MLRGILDPSLTPPSFRNPRILQKSTGRGSPLGVDDQEPIEVELQGDDLLRAQPSFIAGIPKTKVLPLAQVAPDEAVRSLQFVLEWVVVMMGCTYCLVGVSYNCGTVTRGSGSGGGITLEKAIAVVAVVSSVIDPRLRKPADKPHKLIGQAKPTRPVHPKKPTTSNQLVRLHIVSVAESNRGSRIVPNLPCSRGSRYLLRWLSGGQRRARAVWGTLSVPSVLGCHR